MRVEISGVSSVTVAHDADGFMTSPPAIVPPMTDAAFAKDSLRETTGESLGTENPVAVRGAAARIRLKKRPMVSYYKFSTILGICVSTKVSKSDE